MKKPMKMNLQFFAEPDGGNEPPAQGQQTGGQTTTQQTQNDPQTQPVVDYAKIQQMLEGTLSAKEDTALKAYFKQQGLSQQEAEHAMASFKAEKAKNQPDVGAMQNQITQAQQIAMQANIEKEAMFMASELGVELKTMPYVLKLADLSSVKDEKGGINKESLKESLNKVLEELPELKPSKEQQSGFRQIGAAGSSNQQQTQQTQNQVPTKRWNRFN